MPGFSKPNRRQKLFNREKGLRKQKRRAKRNRGRYSLDDLDKAFHDPAALRRRLLGEQL